MEAKEWFTTAAAGFRTVAAGIDPAQLGQPGLGEWDVRALLGHTCRAFSTIETYLRTPVDANAVHLDGAAGYFRAALDGSGAGTDEKVRQRGVEAGAALGEDAVNSALAIVDRVAAMVEQSSDDAPITTPFGSLTLIGYLPTRAFELTVHGLDLARAIGPEPPPELMSSVPAAIDLCGRIAPPDQAVDILFALTGRATHPSGFSVL